ncbi:hypothetical protein [Kribbia dieselivorans]|uniref:hypothetical protein n=1 Tax=Kribbia dieselivorans TaxID=331526 RepID=UPI0008393DBE|nr:hypothetical protein [Kribbia dieselivorans]
MSEVSNEAGTSTVVCDECGSHNEWGTAFCGSCGAYLDWDGQPSPEEPAVVEPVALVEAAAEPLPATAPEPAAEPQPAVAPESLAPETAVAPEPEVAPESKAKTEVSPGPVARSASPKQPAPQKPAPQKPAPQQPAARQPAAEAKPKPKRPAPTHNEPPLRPGDLVCGTCGTGNAPARNFCRRCGSPLADATVVAADPWWRRLFSRRSAAPAAGTRPKIRRRSRLPGRLVALALVAAVVYGVVAFAWPWWKGGAQDSVLDRVSGTQRYEPTTVSA